MIEAHLKVSFFLQNNILSRIRVSLFLSFASTFPTQQTQSLASLVAYAFIAIALVLFERAETICSAVQEERLFQSLTNEKNYFFQSINAQNRG